MSRGLVAPVRVQSRTPKLAASTVNSMYFPLTRKLLPTSLASTILFWSPESPSSEKPPLVHPFDEAAKPGAATNVSKSALMTSKSLRHQTVPKLETSLGARERIRIPITYLLEC